MNIRKICSITLVLLGLIVFLFAVYAKQRVADVKQSVHSSSKLFSDNPVDKGIGKALDSKLSSYDTPLLVAMIGGIVLMVVGVGTWMYKKKR